MVSPHFFTHRVATSVVLACSLLFAANAMAQQQDPREFPLTTEETRLGLVWADAEGMTLYVHLRDGPETATCTGACAERWPPHEASARHRRFPPAGFSVITHPDGLLQWAYRNQPLYRSASDREPGEITGHGHNDAWWVAEPEEEHLDLRVSGQDQPDP